jgi:hypothetical protein
MRKSPSQSLRVFAPSHKTTSLSTMFAFVKPAAKHFRQSSVRLTRGGQRGICLEPIESGRGVVLRRTDLPGGRRVFGSTPRMIGGPLIGLLVQNLAALPGYNRAGSTDNSVSGSLASSVDWSQTGRKACWQTRALVSYFLHGTCQPEEHMPSEHLLPCSIDRE